MGLARNPARAESNLGLLGPPLGTDSVSPAQLASEIFKAWACPNNVANAWPTSTTTVGAIRDILWIRRPPPRVSGDSPAHEYMHLGPQVGRTRISKSGLRSPGKRLNINVAQSREIIASRTGKSKSSQSAYPPAARGEPDLLQSSRNLVSFRIVSALLDPPRWRTAQSTRRAAHHSLQTGVRRH